MYMSFCLLVYCGVTGVLWSIADLVVPVVIDFCGQLCVGSLCKGLTYMYTQYRFSRKNMLLAALWFSEEKPVMSTLLGPLMEEMNGLFQNGI